MTTTTTEDRILNLDVDDLTANPRNLRADLGDLAGLVASIREHGVLQPILVTETDDDSYLVIAGHRRLRAAVLAQLTHVPAIMRADLADTVGQIATMLGENADREGLTVVEEAKGYQLLLDAGLGITAIGKRLGRKASDIKKALPAAAADERVQALLNAGTASLDDLAALAEFEDDPAAHARLAEALGAVNFKYELANLRDKRNFEGVSQQRRAEIAAQGIIVSDGQFRPGDPEDGKTWERLPSDVDPTEAGEVQAIFRRHYGNPKDPVEVTYFRLVDGDAAANAEASEREQRLAEAHQEREEFAAAAEVRREWLVGRAARESSVSAAAKLTRQMIIAAIEESDAGVVDAARFIGVTVEHADGTSRLDHLEAVRAKVATALSRMLLPQLTMHLYCLQHQETDGLLEDASAWGPEDDMESWAHADIIAWRTQLKAWRYPLAPIEQRYRDAAADEQAAG